MPRLIFLSIAPLILIHHFPSNASPILSKDSHISGSAFPSTFGHCRLEVSECEPADEYSYQ